MTKTLLLLVFLLVPASSAHAVLASSNSEKKAEHQELLLVAGLQRVLDLSFEPCSNSRECIRLGNMALVEIQYSKDKKQLIFTPVKPGESNIVIRDERGDIRLILDVFVLSADLPKRADELTALFKDVPGIKVALVHDHINITGELGTMAEVERLAEVREDLAYKAFLLVLVRNSAALMKKIAASVKEKLGDPGVKVEVAEQGLVLTGKAAEPGAVEKKARAIAGLYRVAVVSALAK